MKKCIFLYRQRYLSYLVLLLLLWPTVMLAAQENIQIKGKFSLKEAIRYIEETSDYTFFYKDSDLKDKSKKEINCSGTIESSVWCSGRKVGHFLARMSRISETRYFY